MSWYQGKRVSPDEQVRLRSVQLPMKIKCDSCRRNLNQANFSVKRLDDLRRGIQEGDRNVSIDCSKCVGGPIVEILCTFCNEVKGLEEFAKSQRKNLETARCYECTEEQVNHEPFDEARYEAGQVFITPDDSAGKMPDYHERLRLDDSSSEYDWSTVNGDSEYNGGTGVSLTNTFNSMYLSNPASEGALIEVGQNQNGSKGSRSGSWHTGSSAVKSNLRESTAQSQGGTERTYASSIVERSVSSNLSPNSSRPKASGPAVMHPMGDLQHQLRSETDPWDFDSDDDNDEDNDEDSDGENTVI